MPLHQIAAIYYPRLNYSSPVLAPTLIEADAENYRNLENDANTGRIEGLMWYLKDRGDKDDFKYQSEQIIYNSLMSQIYPYNSSDFILGNPYTRGFKKRVPPKMKSIDEVLMETGKIRWKPMSRHVYRDIEGNLHWSR